MSAVKRSAWLFSLKVVSLNGKNTFENLCVNFESEYDIANDVHCIGSENGLELNIFNFFTGEGRKLSREVWGHVIHYCYHFLQFSTCECGRKSTSSSSPLIVLHDNNHFTHIFDCRWGSCSSVGKDIKLFYHHFTDNFRVCHHQNRKWSFVSPTITIAI